MGGGGRRLGAGGALTGNLHIGSGRLCKRQGRDGKSTEGAEEEGDVSTCGGYDTKNAKERPSPRVARAQKGGIFVFFRQEDGSMGPC